LPLLWLYLIFVDDASMYIRWNYWLTIGPADPKIIGGACIVLFS
jgi:hypothetical protein